MSIGQPNEVQVGGQGTIANKVAFAIAVIGLTVGIVVAFNDIFLAGLILVPATVVLLVSISFGLMRLNRRAWITDTGNGFVYRDRKRSITVDDEDLIGFHLISKTNYSQGNLKSFTRNVDLKVASRDKKIHLIHTVKLDHHDPLAEFLERTVTNYQQRAQEALESGARLHGAGWSLGRADLDVEGTNAKKIAISELVAIDTIDREYHVWHKDDAKPVLRVPLKTDNSFLLGLMLGPRIIENTKEREFDLSEPGLGRQIFQRLTGRVGRILAWCCLIAALACVPVAVVAFFSGDPTLITVGVIAMIASPLSLLIGLGLLKSEFRCHERGVYKRGLTGQKEMRFENVDTFVYSATRQYYNGAYAGTSLELKFVALPGHEPKSFRYSRQVQNADEALDGLREHISRVLMVRMANELSEQGQVQWMPNVRISTDGLHYKPHGFVKRKEEEFLRFDEVTGIDIQEGTFHVWKADEKKSVIHESAGEPNFFPGYMLLVHLFTPTSEEQATDADVEQSSDEPV